MAVFIHQLEDWPEFRWDHEKLAGLLAEVRHHQGRLLGKMESLGFSLQNEASLETITLDVLKSSEIEGEMLNPEQVRSSVARQLGIDIAGMVPADHDVEGIVEMMLDATQNHQEPLTEERMFNWHAAMFPTGRSGIHQIVVDGWRNNPKDDPMQVVSGRLDRPVVHYQAPDSDILPHEMKLFLDWFNAESKQDPVIKAAIAHLWFVTIHPFDDGNGRIARAITDRQLARADKTKQRFYSMSAQIRKERKQYYDILEKIQKGNLDITEWIQWFLDCLDRAMLTTDETLSAVLKKAKLWEKYSNENLNDRQVLMLNKLLSQFVGKLTSSKWAAITKCSSDTAVRDINDLLKKGILVKESAGGRSTSYKLVETNIVRQMRY